MKDHLKEILNYSQSKYYHYPVACILECNDGTLYRGVNVETSSPAAGICAERAAIYSAISNGRSKDDFKALHLMSLKNDEIYPCFICRQTLHDFCNPDVEVIVYMDDKTITKHVSDFTPFAFGEENL